MKKTYVTPLLSFENLAAPLDLSSNCNLEPSNAAEYQCPVYDEESDWTIFQELGICTRLGDKNSVCYHVSIDTATVFSS